MWLSGQWLKKSGQWSKKSGKKLSGPCVAVWAMVNETWLSGPIIRRGPGTSCLGSASGR